MLVLTEPVDPRIHEAAVRAARRCRFIIQAVLREEEWADADYEFYIVIREVLEGLLEANDGGRSTTRGGA